ncbi:MAG: 5-(carboxyamino)imidazole ribonucleotide mutase [Coriobacteriia bacterium]|nr:5-(carboxyamino)imidazole ribonucleotide mutase [Coriobacteriia bacterium]MCL2746465.1 5-(carboxyamino)imidazole ribonucleotide mutase [Coriobacteriia bacterium]MCL2870739.1 5-(carboxyamino)imidazole ribonucleotide mutase [Coriobacteriia bacterium]
MQRIYDVSDTPLVGVIMGSKSDLPTMQEAIGILEQLEISYEAQVVSAHRTPDLMFDYAQSARDRGLRVIVAGAGGAAHLPGMVASKTTLPVVGVPVQSKALNGIDSLLSIAQMPGGIPVATVAIGAAGAKNAGLLAASILSTANSDIAQKLDTYRVSMTDTVLESSDLND